MPGTAQETFTKPTLAVWSCNWNQPWLQTHTLPLTSMPFSCPVPSPVLLCPHSTKKTQERNTGLKPDTSVRIFRLGSVACSLEGLGTQGPVGQALSSWCAPQPGAPFLNGHQQETEKEMGLGGGFQNNPILPFTRSEIGRESPSLTGWPLPLQH